MLQQHDELHSAEIPSAAMPHVEQLSRHWLLCNTAHHTGAEPAPATDEPTAIAIHDDQGRIHVDIASEDAIHLQSLQTPRLPPPSSAFNNETSVETNTVPTMTICIMIVGTRGDVQPFVGIAKRLQADGHRVRLATHAVYRDLVTEHGVEFYPLGGDPKELAAYMVKTGGHLIPVKYETITQDVPRNMQMIEEILNSTWPAVSAPDPDALGKGVPGKPFQAQAIISNPVTYGHIHVAERLGVPLHIMFPQPWVPTVAFPHPLSNMPYDDKPQKRNYMSYKLVDLLMWQGTESMVNQFRTQVLGLRKIRKGDGGRDILLDLAIPHAFMWSPALVPKPDDWGNIYDVIGTVLLKEAGSKYTPTPELEAFLGDDGGPVFVGFGSMVIEDPKATTEMIIEAARLANTRVLIQSSWSDMAAGIDVPDNIFFLGNCPHDWLMPRVSAVVHHGGAGTTAAGLLAGKPTFIVPFFGDQPFWGRAVVRVGVGVEPCPISELSVEKLHAAFEGLQTPEIRERALELRDVMQSEDGVGEAVKCFYRHLPVKIMRCEVCDKNLATKWSIDDDVRLCDVCHFVIAMHPRNHNKQFADYRSVSYGARGPSSGFTGAAAGVGALLHEVGGAVKDVFVKPAKGFRHDGARGVAVGIAQGLGGLVIRPVHGVVLLADHIATGHLNFFRADGTHKRGTVIDGHLLSAIGQEDSSNDFVSAGMSTNEINERAGARGMKRQSILIDVSTEAKEEYCAKFNELRKLRQTESAPQLVSEVVSFSTQSFSDPSAIKAPMAAANAGEFGNVPSESHVELVAAEIDPSGCISVAFNADHDTIDSATLMKLQELWGVPAKGYTQASQGATLQVSTPKMSVCLATIGTWHHNVKQYVAVAVRLAHDGHRVRVAAHKDYRHEIVSRGLEFYPLEGSPEDMHEMIRHLQSPDSQKQLRPRLFFSARKKMKADVRATLFSLWPACTSADPDGTEDGVPGEHFRADFLIAHPFILSHVHVAERLGIPLHCVCMSPISPTLSFPHILTSITESKPTANGDLRESNLLSYSVVNNVLWRAALGDVNDFRASIGLTGGWTQPNILVEREVPHTYLWEPCVLPRPIDWAPHLAVAGHISLTDKGEREKWTKIKLPRSLNEFVLSTGAPVIYVGFSSIGLNTSTVRSILERIDKAAQLAKTHVLVQVFREDTKTKSYHSDNVYEVAVHVPFAVILRKVAATIHCGSPSMTWEGLAEAKPVCIWPRASTQWWFACALSKAGCGPPPIELANASVEALSSTFQALVGFKLRSKAAEFACGFAQDAALERVIETIYSNLPVPAMVCDLDNTKVARIYDVVNEMKLSYEAHLAIREIRGHDGKQDIPYKPLYYSGSRPPKYSLRGIRGETRCSPPRAGFFSTFDSMTAAFSALRHQSDTTAEVPTLITLRGLQRVTSFVPDVRAKPKYWGSDDEERQQSQDILNTYERVVRVRSIFSA